MSGERSGVQKRIREKQPKAIYTHCAGHSFNLAILSSCTLPPIRNCIDQVKSITLWIKNSPKRDALLKAVVNITGNKHNSGTSRTPLLNVCITRWVENIEGWERFTLCHPFLVKMCEVILYGDTQLQLYNDGWSAEDKKNALAYLKILESFQFIFSLVTQQRTLLVYMKEAVVKLQGKKQDIVTGIALVQDCIKELKDLRSDIQNYSERIFQLSCRLAARSDVSVTVPRICQRQQHRMNQQSDSPEEYYKTTITIPFLDQLISDLSCRFDRHAKQAASLQGLLPTFITKSSSPSDIKDAVEFYSEDLPNADIVDEEFYRWKHKWLLIPSQNRPHTLHEVLQQCSEHGFLYLFTLLKLFATIPLSSCSCERSASALKRLNSYLRCTQTEERLSYLALIHMNYETSIDVNEVCKSFLEKNPRRMQSVSLL